MRPIHAALVLLGLFLAVGGAYFLIRADTSAADVASAAPRSAVTPSALKDTDAAVLEAPEDERPGAARVAGATAPPATPEKKEPERAARKGSSALTGRVVDPFGNPIAGASVYAAPLSPWNDDVPLDQLETRPWMKRSEATADDRGRFEIEVEDVARTRIALRAPRCVPYDGELGVSVGETRDVGDLALEASVVLSGRVVDREGHGVAGAELRRMRREGGFHLTLGGVDGALLTETDAQGRFEIDQLAAGPWRIGIASALHPDTIVTGETRRPGEVVTGLEFVVDDGLEIAGRVTGAPDDALAGMRVAAYPDLEVGDLDDATPATRRSVPVEDDGSFVLRGLRRGRSYRLQGREGLEEGTLGRSGRSLTEAVTAEPGDRGVELPHRPETALAFQVVDDATGEPLERFDVSAGLQFPMPLRDDSGRTVRVHPEGRVRFANLRPTTGQERAQVKLEATGYATYERADLVLDAGLDTDLGVIRLERAPTVTVRVVDDKNNAPVELARVRLEEVREQGSGGTWSTEISVDMEEDHGHGLGDVELPLFGSSAKSARTDADGVAVLTSLPGKQVQVIVRAKGYAPYKSPPLALPLGKDFEYDVRVGLGGSVLVRVVDPDGNPVAGEHVTHEGPGGDGVAFAFGGVPTVTDAGGELLFENLEPGKHRFRPGQSDNGTVMLNSGGASFNMVRRVSRSGGQEPEPEGVEVEVSPGSSATIALVARRRSGVVGRVTEAGMSLAGATVSLIEAGADPSLPGLDFMRGGGPESRTNGSGEYNLDGVEVGEYTLRVTHPSRTMPYEQPIEVVDGGSELDVDLPATVIRGRVTDVEGEPLQGVRVRPERYEGGERRVVRQVMIMMTDDGDSEGQVLTGDGSFEPVVTDALGEYELRGVQPDVELVVKAEGEGVQPGSSQPVRLLPGDVREDVDVELEPGGKLVVNVTRADGSGAAMCMVTAEYQDERGREPKSGFTSKSGKATLDGLRPGRWKISVRPMGFGGGQPAGENPETMVEVVAGENEPARLALP